MPETQWTVRPQSEQSSTSCSSFAFEIGLHVQELEAKHLRLKGDPMGAAEAGGESLVDDPARGRGLLSEAPDRALEDVARVMCAPAWSPRRPKTQSCL